MQIKKCMKNQKQSKNNDETSSDITLMLQVRYMKSQIRGNATPQIPFKYSLQSLQ